MRGNPENLTKPGIAMVGTRLPTPYGSGMVERLGCDLAAQGLVIVSGMARGVDTDSHRGAVSAKSKTVAVFGTGVDVIYPKENSRLSEQIPALGGTLIWEFPMGTFPAPQNFPIRNRILSGMSVGVRVVEAAQYSGTRITARCALEQERDDFAVPPTSPTRIPGERTPSSNRAPPSWCDLGRRMGRFPTEVRLTLTPASAPESQEGSSASLFPNEGFPPHEKRILSLLKADEATHIDEIVEKLETELSSSETFAALFELELTGSAADAGEEFCKKLLI